MITSHNFGGTVLLCRMVKAESKTSHAICQTQKERNKTSHNRNIINILKSRQHESKHVIYSQQDFFLSCCLQELKHIVYLVALLPEKSI